MYILFYNAVFFSLCSDNENIVVSIFFTLSVAVKMQQCQEPVAEMQGLTLAHLQHH